MQGLMYEYREKANRARYECGNQDDIETEEPALDDEISRGDEDMSDHEQHGPRDNERASFCHEIFRTRRSCEGENNIAGESCPGAQRRKKSKVPSQSISFNVE